MILWSQHEETKELPGERDNARNNARCTQARKITHGLDGQHQYVDKTPRERVSHTYFFIGLQVVDFWHQIFTNC